MFINKMLFSFSNIYYAHYHVERRFLIFIFVILKKEYILISKD